MSRAQREYKLVVAGAGGTGKSALALNFVEGRIVDEYNPTADYYAYRKQCVIDDEVALLDVLDTAGQEKYGAMRDQYIRTGDGFLLVYSATSRTSFEEISTLHQQILRIKEKDSFPVIVVANKCDSDLEYERQPRLFACIVALSAPPRACLALPCYAATQTEGRELAERFGCRFIETSAKQSANVDAAFSNLVRDIRKYDKEQQTSHPDGLDQNSGGCCGGCVVV
ncbi:hypothetical protein FA95DRAFT_1603506 [Auriscalpium vulgare]|uniref:Uncharacterized protein n=1 Tax=Auriscalpium vulgare TaxID=40419 RepID=A0ACB8S358_9AGAM|nr:hypothetical protein FA95DRAFT_1603506 [Auriscalpium vulgare]